jgi:polyisoprenoid-binding protein YceI
MAIDDTGADAPEEQGSEGPVGTGTRSGRRWAFAAVAVLALAAVGWFVVRPAVFPPLEQVSGIAPKAPRLNAGTDQRLFRFDPEQSTATYSVKEELAGKKMATAVGSTSAVSGDVVVDDNDASASVLGTVVVDVHQMRSDNALRDARVQMAYLESHDYPLAEFTPDTLDGLPKEAVDDKWYPVTVSGRLKVHGLTEPSTWKGKVRLSGDELQVKIGTTVKMSTYDVGPISLVGMVRTADDVALSLDLVAVDVAVRQPSTVIEVPDPSGPEKVSDVAAPSYAKDVEPILAASCASCHAPDQAGSEALSLATAADARKYAAGIALSTSTRYMPPWLASDKNIPLQHDPRLSTKAITTLQKWADAGAPLDVEETKRIRSSVPAPPAPRRDVVLASSTPYQGDGKVTNDYRCFILDPKFVDPTIVTGYAFEPDRVKNLHHALIYRSGPSSRAEAESKDGADGRPGWTCYGGTGLSADPAVAGITGRSRSREALFAGWAPGQAPRRFGAGTGFKFEPGDFIVIQIHYHFHKGIVTPPDQSKVSLETTAPSPDLREIYVANPIAPVEMPCAPGVTGPLCDRSAARADLQRQYGAAASISDFALKRCQWTLADMPKGPSNTGSTFCDNRLPSGGQIVDVLGHMHELGTTFRMTLNPGRPTEKVLLDIPRWDFSWQLNYQPVEAVNFSPGDVLRIECGWDRSLRSDPDPRYLLFGEGTEDEMCFSTIAVLPAQPGSGNAAVRPAAQGTRRPGG